MLGRRLSGSSGKSVIHPGDFLSSTFTGSWARFKNRRPVQRGRARENIFGPGRGIAGERKSRNIFMGSAFYGRPLVSETSLFPRCHGRQDCLRDWIPRSERKSQPSWQDSDSQTLLIQVSKAIDVIQDIFFCLFLNEAGAAFDQPFKGIWKLIDYVNKDDKKIFGTILTSFFFLTGF